MANNISMSLNKPAQRGKQLLDSKALSKLVVNALEDVKGQAITVIDVGKLTQITDYMVIATGTSNTHIKALADKVLLAVKDAGGHVVGIEGLEQAEWVLVDLGGVVVHIMLAPARALYNLEDLWNFGSAMRSERERKP
ncbi:MAG: hypothetical protein RLZZ385_2190 [Pseudomonadota bacterium]|jgi:ribosome-associated protein